MIINKKQNKRIINPGRILLHYAALTAICMFFIMHDMVRNVVDVSGKYAEFTVHFVSRALDILNISSTANGSLLVLPTITLNVLFGCNGLEVVIMFSIGILVYPASWRMKLLGITAGFVLIQILNMLRIVGLAYTAVYYQSLFDKFHFYIFGWLMAAMAFGMFVFYSRFCVNASPKRL